MAKGSIGWMDTRCLSGRDFAVNVRCMGPDGHPGLHWSWGEGDVEHPWIWKGLLPRGIEVRAITVLAEDIP